MEGSKKEKSILQTEHCASIASIAMEDSKGQKFTGAQKAVKQINQLVWSGSRNYSKIRAMRSCGQPS